jgi:hypothetical protein
VTSRAALDAAFAAVERQFADAEHIPGASALVAVVQPYVPTHWWLSFDSLLRTPIDTTELTHGLLSIGLYIVIFCSVARAKASNADITS